MAMHAPYSRQAMPMQRGYSDPRRSPPNSHASSSPTIHPGSPYYHQHQHLDNAPPARSDSYTPYSTSPPTAQREGDFTSYAKRRKTTSALSAPFQRPQIQHHAATAPTAPYSRPSPYPYPSASPSMGGSGRLTPSSAGPTELDSWQWSFFPDQRNEDRGGNVSRLATKSSADLSSGSTAARTTKQSGRHQRKRSAGCLNCHTVWSPTWRKDAQGSMRCECYISMTKDRNPDDLPQQATLADCISLLEDKSDQ